MKLPGGIWWKSVREYVYITMIDGKEVHERFEKHDIRTISYHAGNVTITDVHGNCFKGKRGNL